MSIEGTRTRRKGGKKSIWDAQLDARLLEIIEEEDLMAKKEREANGANGATTTQRNWKRIAQKLGEGEAFGRRQCQERFVNHINPAAEERQVSQEESKILCELFQLPEYGRNWSKLSQEIHRRDPSKKPHVPLTLKNRFWSSVRKARRCLARKKPLTPKLKNDIDNDPVLNYFYYNESKLPPQTSNVNKRKQTALAGQRRNKKRRAGDLKEELTSPLLLHGVVGDDQMGALTADQFEQLQRMKIGMGGAAAAHDMALRQLAIQRYNGQSDPAGGLYGASGMVSPFGAPVPSAHPSSRGEDPQQQARFALDSMSSMKLNSANVPTFSQSMLPGNPQHVTAAMQQMRAAAQVQAAAAQAAQQQMAAASGMLPINSFPPFSVFGTPSMFMQNPAAMAAAMSSAAAHQPTTSSVDSYSSTSGTSHSHPPPHSSSSLSHPSSGASSSSSHPSLAGALVKNIAGSPSAGSSSLPGQMPGDSSAISTMAAMHGLNSVDSSAQMMQMLGATNSFYNTVNTPMDLFKRYVGSNASSMANPFKGGSGANVGNSMLSPESPRGRELNDAGMRSVAPVHAVRPPVRGGANGGAQSPDGGVADPNILRGVPTDTKPRLQGIAAN